MPRLSSRTATLIVIGLVSLLAGAAALSNIDLRNFFASFSLISFSAYLAAAGLLILGACLAAVRLWFIATGIGLRLNVKDTLLALSVGQLLGAVSVQFFGQIVARSALLGRRGVSAPANIVIAFHERLIAVGISAAMAAGGVWFLFGNLTLDIRSGGDQLIIILAGLLAALAGGSIFGWGRLAIAAFQSGIDRQIIIAIARSAGLTLLIQLTTACAYVILASSLAPNISIEDLFSASFIVMFAASLPISFAGWGIRELSAVVALSAVGVGSAPAVAVAVAVGTLALGAMVLIAAVAVLLPRSKSYRATGTDHADPNVEAAIKWVLPLMAVTAVFFQLHLPVGGAALNVNLADPIAILGGGVFVLYRVIKQRPHWRLPGLNAHVALASLVIALSFVNGTYSFGWIDWAFTNKLLGWLVLLAYGATGALIVHRYEGEGLTMLTRTFAGVAAGIVVLAVVIITIRRVGLSLPETFFPLPLEGFSQNRNAFAFALIMAACLAPLMDSNSRPWLLGTILVGIWLTGSRAAAGTLPVVMAVGMVSGCLDWRAVLKALLFAAALLVGMEIVAFVVQAVTGVTDGNTGTFSLAADDPVASNTERLRSVVDGLAMFAMSPIFGMGLGSHTATQTQGVHVIIHSTPIWLMAEMGILGLLAFVVPAIRILLREIRHMKTDAVSGVLVMIVLTFAIMSTVHELLYQRAMWLLFGAALAFCGRITTDRVR